MDTREDMDTPESPDPSCKPFGSCPAIAKDNVYLLRYGHVYTTPCVVMEVKIRFFAVVTLTARRAPVELTVAGRTAKHTAVAIKPPTQRHIAAENVRFVGFYANPMHPRFRAFRSIPDPGVLSLDRNDFAAFDEALEAAYTGQLSIEETAELHDKVFTVATRSLPEVGPLDTRVRRVVELLDENPAYSLEELAGFVKLSYKRVSCLFAEEMGVPLRSYLLWKKMHSYVSLAASDSSRSITEITHAAGFTDSAHLCRTFHAVFGAPPSYFFTNDNVRMRSWLCHGPMPPTMRNRVAARAGQAEKASRSKDAQNDSPQRSAPLRAA